MRKRKSPIFLVTTLGIVCAVAFGLQYVSSKTGGPGAEAPPAPPTDVKPIGDPRAAENKNSVARGIHDAINTPSGAKGKGGGPPGGPQEGGPRMAPGMGGPLVLKPQMPNAGAPEKPKPNTSATSSHWYDKDSMMGNEK